MKLLSVYDEVLGFTKPFELFDPNDTWKRKTLENYEVEELLKPIFIKGELVYNLPTIDEIRAYCKQQVDSLWDEVKRFENPHDYYVDLTQKLWDIKRQLLVSKRNNKK